MQKTFTFISMLAFVLVAVPFAHAEETTTTNADTTAIACLKTAVATREASLKTAITDFNDAVLEAYNDRADSLSAAYSKTSKKEVMKAVVAAWKTFKGDLKAARADWKEAKKDAWSEFKTDRKECRPAKGIDDGGNQNAEA